MIRFKSIISRIIVLHVIAIVVTSVVMSVALSWLLSLATKNIHDEAMQEQAAVIAQHVILTEDGRIALDLPPVLQGLYSQPYGRYSYSVLDDHDRVLMSSRKDGAAIFPVDPKSKDTEFLQTQSANAAISGASIRKVLNGRAFRIQAGEDLSNRDVLIDDIVADFFKNVGWITMPILLALLAIDIVIFRRALQPLRDASETAKRIGPARTDVRLPLAEIPSEVRPLVFAVNQAFERLDEGFRVQREFTADAAHELRTPLSILRSRVDTLDDQAIAEILRKDIEAMGRVVGQLLDIAELDASRPDPDESVDLREICVDVAKFIAPLALGQGKDIALLGTAQPVWVRGNTEMLYRAIRNLTENAIKHTPKGTTVDLLVERDGSITVSDRGPGIPQEERDLIFQRFWRRDRSQAGSSGLGLSIVQRIAELHSAAIEVRARPSGGAAFVMRFPLQDSISRPDSHQRNPVSVKTTVAAASH